MNVSTDWKDYELIDAYCGEKYEISNSSAADK